MKISVNRELLTRYVRGECTAAELEEVKKFLFQPAWQQALEELLEEDFAAFGHTPPAATESMDWNRLFQERYIDKPPVRTISRLSRWIGYAAACLILLGTCYWYFMQYRSGNDVQETGMAMKEQANPRGQRSVITLPDSTIVYLGAASSIRYPEKFGHAGRELTLAGEAFFEVAHDPEHPFIVHTGDIQTRVLGTSFNIDAFNNVVVSVNTGKVQVTRMDSLDKGAQPVALLTRGQQVTWDRNTERTNLSTVDQEEIKEWVAGKRTFVNARLDEIAATLERWGHMDIRFREEDLAGIRMSLIVTSSAPTRHFIDIICNTAHLKYHTSENTIIISKH